LSAGQGVPHLFQKDIKNFPIIIPPYNSQKNIVDYIEKKNELFNKLSKDLSVQIERLKEYRQSLILETVTGKVDVREWRQKKV